MEKMTYENSKKATLAIVRAKFGLDQVPSFDVYKEDENHVIPIFEYLLNLSNKDVQLFLWNNAPIFSLSDYKNLGASKETINYLKKRIKQNGFYNKLLQRQLRDNINQPIETDSLILKGQDEAGSNLAEYQKHLAQDGDFVLYTSKEALPSNIANYTLRRPWCFCIFSKNDMRMLGMIGLYDDEFIKDDDNEYFHQEIEYYIYKNERGKGYAKEAAIALIKAAFENGLWRYCDSIYQGRIEKKKIKLKSIRATVKTENRASAALIESLGFIKEGVIHERIRVPHKNKNSDDAIYWLPNPCSKR